MPSDSIGNKIVSIIKGFDKKQLFILILIFLIGFGIRGHLLRYEYMFEFDSYYEARMTAAVIQTGIVPEHDPLSYYFMGGGWPPRNHFFLYFTAAIYDIFTLGAPYDKMLWIQFVKVLPALFGALTAVAMFFLGKEIYGRKAGYVMAFIAAVMPAFVYRTMAGFFQADCFGFLLFVIGWVFLARAVKSPVFNKKGIINSVLSGISFGLMAITWDMNFLIPLTFGGYIVFAAMYVYVKMGWKEFLDLLKLSAITMAIYIAVATLNYGNVWITSVISYASTGLPGNLALVAFAVAALVLGVILYLAYNMRNQSQRENNAKTINLIAMIMLYCVLLLMVTMFIIEPHVFAAQQGVLGASVGEENTGNQFFGSKYNALIVFAPLALLLLPLRMYREKREHLSAMIFFWVLICFFMAWYKLKFTFAFGLPIAAAAGAVTAELFHYMQGRSGLEQKTVALGLGFLLLTGVGASTIFMMDQLPNIEMSMPTWKPALQWMKDNTPTDSKMFNWWDEGHWITFIGERAVSADNRNLSWNSDSNFAEFVITSDLNRAVEMMGVYDNDYVILSTDMFVKINSFGNYAYNTLNNMDPRIVKFLISPHMSIPCNTTQDSSGNITYACGGNNLPAQAMFSLPDKWTAQSNQIYTAPNGATVPWYIYRATDNSEIYILNPALNESILARLWFQQPEVMQYFDLAYSKEGIRIFKVNKEAIAAAN
ncbi:MAG: hypothetical protein NTW59_04795 [Candidatus Diapherotrites archaeon]|nr:hypothetical protein [Candidatus Diapherotrites archaeon]